MPRDTGAISLLMLAAALLVGIWGFCVGVPSHRRTVVLCPADWRVAES